MPRFRPLIAVFLFAGLTLSGCDSVQPEDSVFLTYEVGGNGVRFDFEGDEIETGRLVDLECSSACDLSVDAFLIDQGFGSAQILSARLQDATLRTVFPIGSPLSILNTAILKIQAGTLSTLEVAEATTLPNQEQASLTVRSGRDLTAYVERSSFRPVLQIDARSIDPGETYDFSVRFSIQLEVSSL